MDKTWLRRELQQFTPYAVAPLSVPTVVNANESPYSVWDIPVLKEAILQELEGTALQKYPLPYADKLRQAVASYVGRKATEVLLGNGGDEMLAMVTQAFVNRGDTVVVHSPTFDMYALNAEMMGAKVVSVADAPDFTHDVKALVQAIAREQPKLVYVCNPNNPTGRLWSKEEVRAIVEAAPYVVVVDEAYMEFTGDSQLSMIDEIDRYPHMFVLRTLSKAFGLAGCRLGYMVGQSEGISLLSTVKAPYNLNVLSQAVGVAVMANRALILAKVKEICAARDALWQGLQGLKGVTAYASATNFILVKVAAVEVLEEALRRAGILVKVYGKQSLLYGHVRITATTMDTTKALLAVFKEVYAWI